MNIIVSLNTDSADLKLSGKTFQENEAALRYIAGQIIGYVIAREVQPTPLYDRNGSNVGHVREHVPNESFMKRCTCMGCPHGAHYVPIM